MRASFDCAGRLAAGRGRHILSQLRVSMTSALAEAPVPAAQKWAITLTVMVVAFMQILDTSVTNVILPHLQGSMSAGLDEVSWVITSYLAANAVGIPPPGGLARMCARKCVFLL